MRGVLLENPLNQRRRRTEFWEAKTTEQLKLKGLYKGERVLLRYGQWRAQVSFV